MDSDSSGSRGLRILITGATGRTGKYVVEQLLGREDVSQIALCTRNPAKMEEIYPNFQDNPRVAIVEMDVSDFTSYPISLKNYDAVIFAHGDAQFIGPIRLLRIIGGAFWNRHPYYTEYMCIQEFVKLAEFSNPSVKFVALSALGLYNPWSFTTLMLNFVLCGALKYKYLASQCLQNSKLNYTIILPPHLGDKEKVTDTVLYNQKWEIYDMPFKFLSCARESVAKVLCDAACDSNKGKRSTLNVWSETDQEAGTNKGMPFDSYWTNVRSDNDSDRLRFARTNYDLPYYAFLGVGITAVALTTKWLFPQRWNAVENFARNLVAGVQR